jgi:hypothetical protein
MNPNLFKMSASVAATTRVLATSSKIGETTLLTFDTAFSLSEIITQEVEKVEGVAQVQRLSRYSLAVTVARLFNYKPIEKAVYDLLARRDPEAVKFKVDPIDNDLLKDLYGMRFGLDFNLNKPSRTIFTERFFCDPNFYGPGLRPTLAKIVLDRALGRLSKKPLSQYTDEEKKARGWMPHNKPAEAGHAGPDTKESFKKYWNDHIVGGKPIDTCDPELQKAATSNAIGGQSVDFGVVDEVGSFAGIYAEERAKQQARDTCKEDVQKAPATSPTGGTLIDYVVIDDDTVVHNQKENTKPPKDEVLSIKTRKQTRALLGASDEHKLLVVVDEKGIPDTVRCFLKESAPKDGVKISKKDFMLVELDSIASLHAFYQIAFLIYKKAPGLAGNGVSQWGSVARHIQTINPQLKATKAVNPQLKAALSAHLMDGGASKVFFNKIGQLFNPAPKPAPKPEPRLVFIQVSAGPRVTAIGRLGEVHLYQVALTVANGPLLSPTTVERAFGGKLGAYGEKGITIELTPQKDNGTPGYKVLTFNVETDQFSGYSHAGIGVAIAARLKKYGVRSDAQDVYKWAGDFTL